MKYETSNNIVQTWRATSLAAIILITYTLFLTPYLSHAQYSSKLNTGELFAGPGYNAIIPLQWEKAGSPTEYHVFRKESGGSFTQIAVVPTGYFSSASYIDENVTAGTEYTYTIKDQDDIDMTNESSATCNNTGHSITIPGWNTTSPTIDGTMTSGEWDDALEIDITNNARIFTTNYWTSKTYAYIKVAGNKLHIAIKDYNNPTMEQNDQIMIFFDYNNDNQWTTSDTDQRYLVAFDPFLSMYTEKLELSGTFPNVSFGSGGMQPPELVSAAAVGTGYLAYELSFDITGTPLDSNTDNFAMLLQSSVYEGTSLGMSGLYSPGGIWKAPSTFINCTVQYNSDTEAPKVASLEGTTEITDNDMNIILSISDQSEIDTVTATYTINGGSAKNITMTASKGNYGYIGTIPAESSATTGSLSFYLKDEHGNDTTTASYTIEWLEDDTLPVITLISAPTIATPNNIPLISASVTDNLSGVESVTLFYTITGQSEQSVSMSYIDAVYSAQLPDQAIDATAKYYILATDKANNIATSDTTNIVWYEGNWYGHLLGKNTGNNFGSSGGITMGLVLELGSFAGTINKLAYMVPSYISTPFNWKVVELNVNGSTIEWTSNILVPTQSVTGELLPNASTWTEIDVAETARLTGTVGLILELQASSYWGRDSSSTTGISWFYDTGNSKWEKLGSGVASDYPGDWNLKAHIYDGGTDGIEKIFGSESISYCYPNPCTENLSIYFENPEKNLVKITVSDMSGKQIAIIQNSVLEKGNYSLNFITNHLPAGNYFYNIITENDRITKKFIISK